MAKFALMAVAAVLVGGWTFPQDMGGGAPAAAQEETQCDVSKAEMREYCAGCKAWPASDQIEKGACKKCKGKIEKVETCIKICWECPKMHDGKPKRHAKNCCASPTCCKETPILALVSYACEACKAKAPKEADVKHATEKCEGKIKKTCAETTKFPHGGKAD